MKNFQNFILEKQKITSAGLILTDGELVLGCHPTNGKHDRFDIPKGIIEKNENPLKACIREVFEETNLKVNSSELKNHGVHEYIKSKNLHVFSCLKDRLPSITVMKCNSYFFNKKKEIESPEIDFYRYIRIDSVEKYFHPKIAKIINYLDIHEKF